MYYITLLSLPISLYFVKESSLIYPEPDMQDTNIEDSIARLMELDPTLITLNLNNHPGLNERLFQQLCDALIPNTYLTSLELAGTGLGDNQGKVTKFFQLLPTKCVCVCACVCVQFVVEMLQIIGHIRYMYIFACNPFRQIF